MLYRNHVIGGMDLADFPLFHFSATDILEYDPIANSWRGVGADLPNNYHGWGKCAAVVGNIIKREGNFLTIRGATIIPRDVATDRRVHFHDDVMVEVGPETKVFKDGYRQSDLSIGALSIGQRVTIRGNQPTPTTDALAPQILFDATQGAVRMHVTHISGVVNMSMPGQTDITLHSIDRRRAGIFDFSGTGPSADLDADPANYEVATGNLVLPNWSAGRPIIAYGFPTPFGMAPPDFTGRTFVDYSDARSALGMGWGKQGTVAPFLRIGGDGLVLDNQNGDIDQRHHVKQGPVLIDLTLLYRTPRENEYRIHLASGWGCPGLASNLPCQRIQNQKR